MDILNDILDTLDLNGALYFRTDFSAPWSVTVPRLEAAARFHLVVQGKCTISVPDKPNIVLNPGDLILIPRGQTHILSDSPVETAPPLETILDQAGYDGEGVLIVGEGDKSASTQLICGHFTFRENADHPILRALPDYLLMTSSERAQNPWLDDVLRLIAGRMFSGHVGAHASVKRLSEVMFIEMLRMTIEDQKEIKPILRGFQEPHVGKALILLHNDPSYHWTVESLAKEVGMSRSSFADKFAELIGQGPMSYLSEWRLQKSLYLLDQRNLSVQQIAEMIGYKSPAAFTRAFAAKFGTSPTKYRR